MKYETICNGTFIDRPNRFIALAEVGGEIRKAHVKNTGRCKELLLPGAKVFLEDFKGRMGSRKLRYSLIAVEKETAGGRILVNLDSQAPNKIVAEAMAEGRLVPAGLKDVHFIKGEYTWGGSRIDFYVEDSSGRKALLEVKGVTLETDGVARFPDAPTERGVKHVEELIKARQEGYAAVIVFVIQMKGVHLWAPNWKTHPQFGRAVVEAKAAGVELLAFDCIVEPDRLTLDRPVHVRTEGI